MASLFDWGIFSAAHYGFGLQYVVAAGVSLVAATLLNYLLSVRYVFVSGRFRRSLEVVLVYFVSAVGVGLNIGLMVVFVEAAGFAALPAKMVATCMVFFWNYLARKHVVFARPSHSRGATIELPELPHLLPGPSVPQLIPVRVERD